MKFSKFKDHFNRSKLLLLFIFVDYRLGKLLVSTLGITSHTIVLSNSHLILISNYEKKTTIIEW